MRRVGWVALSLALVVAAAGCGGLADGGDAPTTTVTPAAVPTADDRPTPTPTVAPGMTGERLVDPGVLLRSHARRLSNASHTFRERVTRRFPNGTVRSRYVTVVERDERAARYRYEGAGRRVDKWASGGRVYTARTVGNRTTYDVSPVSGDSAGIPLRTADYTASLTRVFQVLKLAPAGAEAADGTTRYRLESGAPRDVPPLRNVTFLGYVTPEGVITEYRVAYTTRRGDADVDVTVHVSITDVGTTTVERPAWYERATNATG